TDAAEERTLRRVANARHAPASLIQRARIITASWDGARVPQLAQQLGCPPRRSTSGCTASTTPTGWTGWATCPARACRGASPRPSAAGSSPWPALSRPAACTRAARDSWRLTSPRRRRTGPWTPWPRPLRPRASRSAAARSAGFSLASGCAGGGPARGRPAPTRTSPPKGAGHRLLHHPTPRNHGDLRPRTGPGDPAELPTGARLDRRRPPGQGAVGLQPRAGEDLGVRRAPRQ